MGVDRENFVVDKERKKKEVILPVARYNRLLEDLHDLAAVAERRQEKLITMEEMRRRLRARRLRKQHMSHRSRSI